MIEQLESRTLLSTWATFSSDPGGSMGAAADLGTLGGLRRFTDSLSTKDRSDFFKFSVADKGNFNLALSGLKGNVDVQLLMDDGGVLATSAKKGKSAEKISRFITAGNYFIRVYAAKGFKSGAYRMQLQDDVNWGTIGSGSDTKHVGLVFSNDSSQSISPKKETWVLIHGWFAPGRAIALNRLAGAVDKNSKTDQVLLLDWSDAASTANVFDAASRAPAVAQWAADKLKSWGIASSRINIIGHSLGGLVGDMLGSKLGGVNRMAMLDPATDIPGTFFSGTDFAAHSQYSLSFVGSNYATPAAAGTADETFEMNVGPKDSIVTHSNVVDLFASIVTGSVAKKPDAIGKLFNLDSLKPGAAKPFKKDAFDDIYEGVIDGVFKSGAWRPATLTYKNSSGKTVVVRD